MLLAFDTETHLFAPGKMAPPIVCLSWAATDGSTARSGLVHHSNGRAWVGRTFTQCLADRIPVIGQNVAYDMACIRATWPDLEPLVWELYEQGLVRDTMIREKLIHIAQGCYRGFRASDGTFVPLNYTLDDLSKRYLQRHLDKDTWRRRYHELEDLPLTLWPVGARQYPILDAQTTLEVYLKQEDKSCTSPVGRWFFVDEEPQTRHAWWLQLMSVHGIHTDEQAVHVLRATTQAELQRLGVLLGEYGLVVAGSRKVGKVQERFELLHRQEGLQLTFTDTGRIKTDADACKASGDPLLQAYAEYATAQKTLSADCVAFANGIEHPIHARFESLVATGRTATSKPNLQNIGRRPGLRECFRSRTGLFASADYASLELRTLGQVCHSWLGRSRLAELLNQDIDPLTVFAAELCGENYDTVKAGVKAGMPAYVNARQTAKVAMYGYPGGQGVKSFVLFARKGYGITLTLEAADGLKRSWLTSYPEMRSYFDLISSWRMPSHPDDSIYSVEHLFSGRLRTRVPYCAACNSPFQGLGADATKEAGWLLSKACYMQPQSPLYGARPVLYIHDEFQLEVQRDQGPEAAEELARLMCVGASKYLPDVPPKAEPCLSTRWSKKAKTLRTPEGRLIPWSPGG